MGELTFYNHYMNTLWEIKSICIATLGMGARFAAIRPGVELRVNRKSIYHRCHLFEVAFVWELTKENSQPPLGCL